MSTAEASTWTRRQVKQMLADGLTHRRIAEELGVHRNTVLRIANEAKKHKEKAAIAYIKQGLGATEIARKLGCNVGYVRRLMEDYGGSAPRTVEPYQCPGCAKHGIYSKTRQKPCIICAARKAVPK
jgi:DNA-binding CsgD family transcriptional regulator